MRPAASRTSFRCLEVLRVAGGALSSAIKSPDIERVATERVKAGQHAVAVVPTEGQDLLLDMVGVVFVDAVISPVVNLPMLLCIRILCSWPLALEHVVNQLYLVALEDSAYMLVRDGIPVHLCQSAVSHHRMNVLWSCNWHCDTDMKHKTKPLHSKANAGTQITAGSLGSMSLTVLSRVAVGNIGFRSSPVIVDSLNFKLIWNKRGRSRHNKLGVVGHGH